MGKFWIILIIQIVIILIIVSQKNGYEKGSREWETVRLCKTGMCFAIASFGFGLFGFILAFVSFILGIAGIIKGQTFFGVRVIAASIILPILGVSMGMVF